MIINTRFEIEAKEFIRRKNIKIEDDKKAYVDSELRMAEDKIERHLGEAFKVIDEINHKLELNLSDMDKKALRGRILENIRFN